MNYQVDDTRIGEIKELISPASLIKEFPVVENAQRVIFEARQGIHRILFGSDDRLLVVIGPCSIHDPKSAIEYGKRLLVEAKKHSAELLVVMRVYFSKPRTTVGWKGLINDPELDGSFKINEGLHLARRLLVEINALGLPAGTEYLDMITPQYYADLISWGAIGARTTESQVHRELASGLSCPVGFKNGTDGNVKIAVEALKASRVPHHFLSVTKDGHSAIVSTRGNEDCHVILRGGAKPNYDSASVASAAEQLAAAGLEQRLMIDFSHANSSKDYKKQMDVAADVAAQIAKGEDRISGVMIESHLNPGKQDLVPGKKLDYGVSITDGCVGWEDSVKAMDLLAEAVRKRRLVHEAE